MRHEDLVGQKFESLVVLAVHKRGLAYVLECRCVCGAITTALKTNVLSGNTTSCGCYKKQLDSVRLKTLAVTHGEGQRGRPSAEHRVWTGMLTRCRNPKADSYPHYGGRGIAVCERWLKFENFLSDMGRRPSKHHSIERLRSDGNYESVNCIWATLDQQSRNKRNNRILTLDGVSKTITDWAKGLDLTHQSIRYRLKSGLSLEKALTLPKAALVPFSRRS